MKTKPLTLLLALTFLFLFSGSVYGDDYNEAFKGWKLAAEQGDVEAQYNLGLTYANGEGVPQVTLLFNFNFNWLCWRQSNLLSFNKPIHHGLFYEKSSPIIQTKIVSLNGG